MTLHLPGASSRNTSEQQHELREARRLLKERVRTDWEYPTLPAWKSCGRARKTADADAEDGAGSSGEGRIAGFRFHAPSRNGRPAADDALRLGFEPVEWRERQYSSASDTEGGQGGEAPTPTPTPTKSPAAKKGEAYKFDNPDSVGSQLVERRMAKKRKRYEALGEEMQWNDGLAHWMKRRDAWCCARTATDVQLLQANGSSDEQTGSTSASATSSPRPSTSSSAEAPSTPESSVNTTPDLAAVRSETTLTVISPAEVLVPIAPAILLNHPVRRKIATHMYPEIYAKIILQSRTPSVPINLQTLVNALVQGWKDDGEFPPKSGPLEKSIGRKKGSPAGGLKEGVRAVGRVLRLTGIGDVGSQSKGQG